MTTRWGMPTGPLAGIACMALGFFTFAAVDTIAKQLTADLHPLQIVWARQLGLLAGVVVLLGFKGPRLLKSTNPGMQILRGLFSAGSAAAFIFAVRYVPLADAVAITFIAPFMVTALGAFLLGERVGIRRWTAASIGFIGALIVIRPGAGVMDPAAVFVVLAAVLFALRQIVSRVVAGSDPTTTTVAYTAIFSVAVLSLPVPFVWRTPIWGQELALLVLMAGLAAVAESLLIRSFELAEAVVLAPVHYSLLIWATGWGWLVFGQFPDLWTWVGATIIILTGLYTLHRERLVIRDQSTPPPAAVASPRTRRDRQ